jgi:hypothetical protein
MPLYDLFFIILVALVILLGLIGGWLAKKGIFRTIGDRIIW